jgi:hypothetical protein
MTERRIARRYELAVPVVVGQVGLSNLPHIGGPHGITRDISTSGLYFTTSKPPIAGACVELTFALPRNLTGSNDVLVEVVGRVVRVDSQREPQTESVRNGFAPLTSGVAAHIEKYDIITTRVAGIGPVFAA